jgi:hypothetical protein
MKILFLQQGRDQIPLEAQLLNERRIYPSIKLRILLLHRNEMNTWHQNPVKCSVMSNKLIYIGREGV